MSKQKQQANSTTIPTEILATTCGKCQFFQDGVCYGLPPVPVMIQAIEYVRPRVGPDDKACSKWGKA